MDRPLTIEAFLEVLKAAEAFLEPLAAVLKPHGLSHAQYNVLRILRGAGSVGLSCGQIAERMLTRDPDMTRLLDRLERQGLVSRCREQQDRRIVRTRITERGLAVLRELDEPVGRVHEEQLGHLNDAALRRLIRLLRAARRAA